MRLSWLHQQDSWAIALALMAAMLMFAEIGYWIGRRRHSCTGDTGRGHFSAVQAAMLGLLALLLGFTFNMSSLRYEARRQLVQEDANVLIGLQLRSWFLPDPRGTEFRQVLREYVALRVEMGVLKDIPADDELARRFLQGQALYRRMYELVRTEVQGGQAPEPVKDLVSLLSDALAVHQKRINAYEGRVPDIILFLLLGATVMISVAVGYSGGLGRHRGLLASILFTLLVGATVYTILDLDQPRRGLMQIEQTPLLRVQQYLDQDAQATGRGGEPRQEASR